MTTTTYMTANRRRESTMESGIPFEAIFETHWNRVVGLLFRLLGDRDEAEDIALEVFIRCHERVPDDAEAAHLAGWLYRVATRLGFNALRTRRRRKSYESAAAAQIQPVIPSPSEGLECKERSIRVRTVLGKMRRRSARILMLRHTGLSYAEIASALGLRASSIGKLLARAEAEFEDLYRRSARL